MYHKPAYHIESSLALRSQFIDHEGRTSEVSKMCPSTEPRTFSSLFTGAAEMNEAVTLVGWIAIRHAGVEDSLDYLLWQLDAFKKAARPSHQDLPSDDLQAKLRELRQKRSGVLLKFG
jgi:hypothetical protein